MESRQQALLTGGMSGNRNLDVKVKTGLGFDICRRIL